ncbi:MAG TPA: hypothetical protein P5307_09450 [Pirellulaceae bacterium]|nr:hypothetical protein [Pirellulaceae bacterium]
MSTRPSTIRVICPQCQAAMSISATAANTQITCSDCLEDFLATPIAKRLSSTPPPTDSGDDALQRLLNPDLDGSTANQDNIRREDDLSDDAYPAKKKKPVLERGYEFSVICMICGTRLDVNDSLIGKKVKCPDCHNAIDVRTPSPDKRRAPVPAQSAAADDDDFGLSAVASTTAISSPYHSIAHDLMANAENEVARETPKVAQPQRRAPALDAIERAEAASDDAEQQERPKLPAAPFRTGVLKFLLDPLTIARLIILAIVFFVLIGAIEGAITSAEGAATSQFVSILYRMFAVTVGAVFATNLAVSLLGILQDTANGKDAIESWPDVNFLDWIFEAFYVFSGLFIAVFPACMLAKVLSLAGAPDALYWLVVVGGSSLGILLIFPFALVSMLESGSAIMPVSQPIIRSLRLARGSWIVFTLISVLVIGAGVCLGAARVLWSASTFMNFVIALLGIVVFAIYFRLLGRLTWCCDEAVLAEDIRLEEAAEASENPS